MSQPTNGNWGRWPDCPDRGAANLVDRQALERGLASVTRHKTLSLAVELGPGTWTPKHRPAPLRFMDRDGGDYAVGGQRPSGFQFAEDTWLMPTHSGTHIDAICHVWYDDLLFDGVPQGQTRSTTGARRFGIEHLGGIATRGLLIDVADLVSHESPMGFEIDVDLIESALAHRKLEVKPGDAVLIRTGWLERAHSDQEYFAGEPGIGVPAAKWLAEQGVAMIGADNFALEAHPRSDAAIFPVHQLLLRDFGVPIIETLELEKLAKADAAEFLFVLSPLPLVGATASPVAPIAVV